MLRMYFLHFDRVVNDGENLVWLLSNRLLEKTSPVRHISTTNQEKLGDS